MRNLKRALSLALASVMLLGMMVVGTSAASYPDVDSNDNVEAIEVLNAVEVMIGDRGNFRPDSPVNRHEMAAIMARLYLGKDAAENYVGSHPFTDVYPWADKYVAACYENGLINGTSKTTFSGNQPLTAIQAAAMMLRALGYEDLSKGAADWRTPVAAKANQIRLFKDVVSASNAQLTRNEVAQLALNTLKSTMVTTKKGTNIDLGEIGSITTDREYTPREVDVTRANDPAIAFDPGATVPGKYALQLGEDLYDGKLKLVAGNDDDFGRPGDSRWTYDGKEVYNVVKDATATFTAKTSNANVLKALKGYEYNGKKISVENDVKAIADLTANGKLVEVFVSDNEIIKVVTIAYTLGEVKSVTTNKDGDVRYNVSGKTGTDYADPDKDDTIVIAGEIAKDDVVTYVEANNTLYVYPTTTFTGAQKSWKVATAGRAGTIVVDGNTYNVGLGVTGVAMNGTKGNFPNSDDDAEFYVDQFGFVVKSDAVKTSTSYAVLDGIIYKAGDGLDGKPYAAANLIKPDGTKLGNVKVVKINGLNLETTDTSKYNLVNNSSDVKLTTTSAADATITKLELDDDVNNNAAFKGVIVSYSEDDDKYTLTLENLDANACTGHAAPAFTLKGTVTASNAVTTKGDPNVVYTGTNTSKVATNDTIYVVKKDDKYTTYTGFRNVPTIKDASATIPVTVVVDDDGKAEFVYIDANASTATVGDDSGDIMYLISATKTNESKDEDEIYDAIVNGEKTTIKVKKGATVVNGSATIASTDENKLFVLTYNDKGYVTKAVPVTNGTPSKWIAGAALTADVDEANGIIGTYTYDDSAKVVAIEDGDIIDGATVETAVMGDTIWVKVKGDSAPDNKAIDTIYIVKDGEKSLPNTADADLINSALNTGDKKASLASGATLDGVTVPEGATLTLNGTSSISNGEKITVEDGATLVVKGNVSCTGTGAVELKGGTMKLESGVTTIPKITGEGDIVINTSVAAPTDTLEGVAAAVGANADDVALPTAGQKVTGSVDRNPVTLSGSGSLSQFGSIPSLAGSATQKFGVYQFDVTGLTNGTTYNIQLSCARNGGSDYTTTGVGMTHTVTGDSSTTWTHVMLVGPSITSVKAVLTESSNTYTVIWNIAG